MASKHTSALFYSLSFFHSCPLAQKMITSVAFVFTFCYSYEIRAEDDNKCNVHCRLLHFFSNVEDENEPPSLSSSSLGLFVSCK
jgi:hypothetical protein